MLKACSQLLRPMVPQFEFAKQVKFDKWNILKGDKVVVVQGKDKGKMGTVARVYRKSNEVLVLGMNQKFRRLAPNEDTDKGSIQQVTRPIHVSNVALIDPESGKKTRINRGFLEDGTPVRISKKSGSLIQKPIDPAFSYAFRHRNKTDGVKDTNPADTIKVTYVGEDFAEIKARFDAWVLDKEEKESLLKSGYKMRKDQKKGSVIEKSTTTNNQQIQAKLLGANVNEINIERFRDSKQPQLYQLNGKLSQQAIRIMANKFSLETVFILDLSNQKLLNIDPIQECINLVVLNISMNQISDLNPLRKMTELVTLNLSQNNCSSLDLNMPKLMNIQAKGNQIKSVKSIEPLQRCMNLTTLYLQSTSAQFRNPLCDLNNYRVVLFTTLKQLIRLDGYSKDIIMNDGTELKKQDQDIKIELKNTGCWFTPVFPKVDGISTLGKDDELKTKAAYDACRHLSQDIEMKLALLK